MKKKEGNKEKPLTRKQKAMLEALEKTAFNVSAACRMVGIDRRTHYDWLHKSNTYKKRCEEIQESLIDLAESQLLKKIKKEDLGAIIFFLKTKGKKRGYTERIETETKEVNEFTSDKAIQIYLPKKEDKGE